MPLKIKMAPWGQILWDLEALDIKEMQQVQRVERKQIKTMGIPQQLKKTQLEVESNLQEMLQALVLVELVYSLSQLL